MSILTTQELRARLAQCQAELATQLNRANRDWAACDEADQKVIAAQEALWDRESEQWEPSHG